MRSLETAPDAASLERMTALAEEEMEEAGVPMRDVARALICVDEVFSNICSYSGAGRVRFEVAAGDGAIRMRFQDDGEPFDPTTVAEPDTTLGAEERGVGGLGIHLVRSFMDSVRHARTDAGNELVLEKRYGPGAGGRT